MNKKKARKAALAYIEPAVRSDMYDCSDSMHEADLIKARFDALVDDSIKIRDYILKYFKDEYIKQIEDFMLENDEPLSKLDHLPCNLFINASELKWTLLKRGKITK